MNKSIRLTSAEIANLWASYMNDSMAICVLKHCLEKAEDEEIRPLLQYALRLSEQHIEKVTEIFAQEEFPIPQGFTEQDVNLQAPALFSDTYYLVYLQNMSRVGLGAYSLALPFMARSDVREFYGECITSSTELNHNITNVMLSKGLFVRPAFIPNPTRVEFADHQGLLTGWFHERRTLDAMEITNLHSSIITHIFCKALLMGFGQVVENKDVREFVTRSKEVAQKHIEVFHSIMTESELPSPSSWDGEVLASTTSPFSDRLMLFHTKSLVQAGIMNYGTGTATATRRDLAVHYSRLTAELGKLGEDALNIMIDHGWLEQIPQAEDRSELANV